MISQDAPPAPQPAPAKSEEPAKGSGGSLAALLRTQ